mmetsp:Transcript_87025/g.235942  ORF Transcript_87025/g.235942 Transcript_87025/m.235942 type:complete len:202 (-) Transcript_87025:50-655(-)
MLARSPESFGARGALPTLSQMLCLAEQNEKFSFFPADEMLKLEALIVSQLKRWEAPGADATPAATGPTIAERAPESPPIPMFLVRNMKAQEVAAAESSNAGSEGLQPQQPSFSCGSLGHPGACRGPCKYASKSRGCKDGENCTRCHMCRWSRTGETKKKKKEASAIGSPVAGGSAEVCARIPLRMAELLENDRSLFDTKFG